MSLALPLLIHQWLVLLVLSVLAYLFYWFCKFLWPDPFNLSNYVASKHGKPQNWRSRWIRRELTRNSEGVGEIDHNCTKTFAPIPSENLDQVGWSMRADKVVCQVGMPVHLALVRCNLKVASFISFLTHDCLHRRWRAFLWLIRLTWSSVFSESSIDNNCLEIWSQAKHLGCICPWPAQCPGSWCWCSCSQSSPYRPLAVHGSIKRVLGKLLRTWGFVDQSKGSSLSEI